MRSFSMTLRFQLFRAIEWATHCLHQAKDAARHEAPITDAVSSSDKRYLWVFVTTIGELHAIQPLLVALRADCNYQGLVFLTDHPEYKTPFLKAFPEAIVVDHGPGGKVENALNARPPSLFLIAEIPCLLSDAPCRFSYRVLHEVKKHSTPVVAVNCWLYGEKPSCRMDALERHLLGRAYLESIDLFTVQTEEIRERLISTGAAPEKVFVTGNIKFDALGCARHCQPPKELIGLLDDLGHSGRPVIVAGCVTNINEQEFVLNGFNSLLSSIPEALLVLAPRHPDNKERMAKLESLLRERKLNFQRRSTCAPPVSSSVAVIILDTVGELKYLYGVASLCYVGLNHNVLEPLAADKPVLVTKGWDPAYPSYPVYQETKRSGLVTETENAEKLSQAMIRLLKTQNDGPRQKIEEKLRSLYGATALDVELIKKLGAL